jgi:mannosyl-oligosaccharide glucosidase
VITERSKELSSTFNTRFQKTFPLKPPFTTPRYERFAKQALSSLLGGMSYFHGSYLVDRTTHSSYDEEDQDFWVEASAIRSSSTGSHLEGPQELFTATPSRPFFPRGFYWDEGFHLLPVGDWDNDLALEVLGSWVRLMDEEGWIAREQILGEESRAKVPSEFQTQFPHYANPPTLLMPIAAFIERLQREAEGVGVDVSGQMVLEDLSGEGITRRYLDNPELARHYLRQLYPLLQRHHDWFRRTQAGDIKSWDRDAFSSKEGYRWRGRTPDHCLTSGLDDYPRARPPHTGELHVDLLSWMGLFARTLRGVAEFLGEVDDAAELRKMENAIIHNLDGLSPRVYIS